MMSVLTNPSAFLAIIEHRISGQVLTTSPLHLAATSKASPNTPLNLGRSTERAPKPLLF